MSLPMLPIHMWPEPVVAHQCLDAQVIILFEYFKVYSLLYAKMSLCMGKTSHSQEGLSV